MTSLLDAALARLDENLFFIHPLYDTANGQCSCGKPDCQWPGKHPRLSGYQDEATDDPRKVERLWSRFPHANIGGVIMDGFCEIDVDRRHGGKELAELATVTTLTPDGWHYTCRLPAGFIPTCQKISLEGLGIEVFFAGHNLVLPGSVVHGREYQYALGRSPQEIEIAELPQGILDRITMPPLEPSANRAQLTKACMKRIPPAVIPKGTRHHVVSSIAGSLINYGVRGEALVDELTKIDTHCQPPLGEAEVRRIAKSMQKTHDSKSQNDEWKSKNRAYILEVTRYAIAAGEEWRYNKGKTELAALLGALAIAYEKHTLLTPAAYRSIAEHGGIGLKATHPAVKSLIKKEKGWLILHATYYEYRRHLKQQGASPEEIAEASNVYRFAIPDRCRKKTTVLPTPPQAHLLLSLCAMEVFRHRGLGKSSLQLIVVLLRRVVKSGRQLGRDAGVDPDTADRKVKKMLEVGMVRETDRGIELLDVSNLDMEKIAKRLGTFGRGANAKRLHAAQREEYHERIGLIPEGKAENEKTPYVLKKDVPDSKPPPAPPAADIPVPVQVSIDEFVNMTMELFPGSEVRACA